MELRNGVREMAIETDARPIPERRMPGTTRLPNIEIVFASRICAATGDAEPMLLQSRSRRAAGLTLAGHHEWSMLEDSFGRGTKSSPATTRPPLLQPLTTVP